MLSEMTEGFILISCEHGFEREVMKKLLSKREVREVNLLFGMYDIMVKLECVTPESLRELIIWKIRKINKIRSIVSLIGRESVNLLVN
jgi:DNA-binding Lrp family transcriptional regulator